MNPTCGIEGCYADAVATVRKIGFDGGLAVCPDCRDELTNVFGYEMVFITEELDADAAA